MRPTRLSRLLDQGMGGALADFVRAERANGTGWRAIAAALEQETGEAVSHMAIRSWFADELDDEIGGAA